MIGFMIINHLWEPSKFIITVLFTVALTLKPVNFYNIEKHVKRINFDSKLCMLYVHYILWANHISNNIGSFYK